MPGIVKANAGKDVVMNVIVSQRSAETKHDPVDTARRWLEEHGEVALATVVSTWGSAPVPVGGQLVVAPDERFQGSVSGGCVEADVIAEATDVMRSGRPRLLEFGVTEETAWRSGLPCGGKIKVLLEPLANTQDAAYLERIQIARRNRTPIAVITDVVSGARRLYEPGPGLPPEAEAWLAGSDNGLRETAGGTVFVQVIQPTVRIVIAGGTNIGQVLADLAKQIGYDVIVVDPRQAFLNAGRFGTTQSVIEWPETALSAMELDPRTAVVALTHAAHIDDEALSAALRSSCLYVGALGSKRTHAKRLERLKAAGFTDADLVRIHAPVGLDIGAKGPAEIALSILAEIVKVARGAG
jgi:xanthine dehydrogenase accessory factor